MNLRDWLVENRLRQRDLAESCEITKVHMNLVILGKRRPGKRLAARIVRHTGGAFTLEQLISGDALGYVGPRKVIRKSESSPRPRKKTLPKNTLSLL